MLWKNTGHRSLLLSMPHLSTPFPSPMPSVLFYRSQFLSFSFLLILHFFLSRFRSIVFLPPPRFPLPNNTPLFSLLCILGASIANELAFDLSKASKVHLRKLWMTNMFTMVMTFILLQRLYMFVR